METSSTPEPPAPSERDRYREAYLDPYRPLPPAAAPATGSSDPGATEMELEEEPITTGTLFLTMVILMIIGAIWIVMYILLLNR